MNLASLPVLGIGISAEYGSAAVGLDPVQLQAELPGAIDFLEYGCDLARGLDDQVSRWTALALPTTYHFLDLNLTNPADADPDWLARTSHLASAINAAWLCGDGGLWHFGPRDRGHETLLPPILCTESADEMAEAVMRVQEATGLACLPENPPATIFLGEMHILDYFARVADRSGGGLLLDCAHLAIFQRMRGHSPLTALDAFPLDRVVEMHIAGGTEKNHEGLAWVDDDHSPEPLDDTWQIFEYALERCTNLRAVVYECERNQISAVAGNFQRLRNLWNSRPHTS